MKNNNENDILNEIDNLDNDNKQENIMHKRVSISVGNLILICVFMVVLLRKYCCS